MGPEILSVLEIKVHVLHRVRLHVKVPGWLSDFLSRLNEMSGGRRNMFLVSGSLWRILKFLRMTHLIDGTEVKEYGVISPPKFKFTFSHSSSQYNIRVYVSAF